MRWVVYIAAAIAALVAVVALVGAMLPKHHAASRTARIAMPPASVYALLADVSQYTTWRPDVKSVARLPDRDGRPAWIEESNGMKIPLHFERMEPPSLLRARIGEGLPFGGTWTYRILPAEGGGTDLTITEDGEIYNVIFRFMAKFVFGYHVTMDGFLKNFEARARVISR